jgi:hypothetical protein
MKYALSVLIALMASWIVDGASAPVQAAKNNTSLAEGHVQSDWRDQYALLALQIATLDSNPGYRQYCNERLRPTVFNPEALIQDADRDPVDVLLRRTRALLNDIAKLDPSLDLGKERSELDFLVRDAEKMTVDRSAFATVEEILQVTAHAPSQAPEATPTGRGPDAALDSLMGDVDRVDVRWDPELKKKAEAAKTQTTTRKVTHSTAPCLVEESDRGRIYLRLCALQRRIAFRNPLMDFDTLLVSRRSRGENHVAGQLKGYMARGSVEGGGLYLIRGFRDGNVTWQNVIENRKVAGGRLAGKDLSGGWFARPALSYDGRRVLFAYREPVGEIGYHEGFESYYYKGYSPYRQDWSFHIFSSPVDPAAQGELRMMTDGPHNDASPCFLPSGRIVFVSDRRGGINRCGGPTRAQVLHSMLPDGTDIVPLSMHETEEFSPSVGHDGRIYFSRWDYVDRGDCIAHHPWVCYPDGRDPRAIHGNYSTVRSSRPDAESEYEAIPGSHRFVAVATGHHVGGHDGSLIILDFDTPDDDAMSQVRRLTPEIPFPEVEGGPSFGSLFSEPWPLSENYHLAGWGRPAAGGPDLPQGIYLVDAFGNRILIARPESGTGAYSPIPVRPRTAPPVIPHMAATGKPVGQATTETPPKTGRFILVNVYDSLKPWPAGTEIKSVRVVQLFPRANGIWMNYPDISVATESLARGVVGEAPIEADGSAHFTAPAEVPLLFQAIDEKGRAVQTMRSGTWLQPGMSVTCQGCHEPKHKAPPQPSKTILALRRGPSALAVGPDGSYPVFYPKLVQPVLDRNCVACHTKERSNPKVLDLGADAQVVRGMSPNNGPATVWSKSYLNLTRFAQCRLFGGKPVAGEPRTTPGSFGAIQSKLYPLIAGGNHHGVKLAPDEVKRIALWLDSNQNFYSAYLDTEKQVCGELVSPAITQPDRPQMCSPTPTELAMVKAKAVASPSGGRTVSARGAASAKSDEEPSDIPQFAADLLGL